MPKIIKKHSNLFDTIQPIQSGELKAQDRLEVKEVWQVEMDGVRVGGMYDLGNGLFQKSTGKYWRFPKDLYSKTLSRWQAEGLAKKFEVYYRRLLQYNEQKYIIKGGGKVPSRLKIAVPMEKPKGPKVTEIS